ncbi:hypothetical protein RhiirC2_116329 [Rhizophagus irregularis]|uniref:Uncharacterized protein n=1 Tax=Rhizophagus irregularis TaxID=588596 RepID=A0A2N1MR01_9GLOM|nr:hypothetical protein RhiirC2_116329 [Rhizophagus irregularis]
MNNKVNGIQNIQNIPIMTPPLSSPSTPTLMSNNNNNNNNNNSNIIYTTMHSMPFAEPEDKLSYKFNKTMVFQVYHFPIYPLVLSTKKLLIL